MGKRDMKGKGLVKENERQKSEKSERKERIKEKKKKKTREGERKTIVLKECSKN